MTEVRSTVSELASGLKNNPLILGVLVINVLVLGGAIYFLAKVGEANAARTQIILERCLPKGGQP